jgi:hippurate hydrolase
MKECLQMRSFFQFTLVLVVISIITLGCQALNSAQESQGGIQKEIDYEYPSLEILYRDLHSHPELSFCEQKTSKRLESELKDIGFEVSSYIGGYGIVAILRNGNGPTVLIRTDMDALPVKEQTYLPYASIVRTKDEQGRDVGVMHACGHDVHMTVFVGTARLLTKLKERWQGTLIMIGQPAEEKGAGARAMLGDGLFQRFPIPDYCLALHVAANIPAGKVGYCKGYAMANVDSVDIIIHGIGGHGALPHTTKDPVVIAAQVILALQTIVSREIDPATPAVITVGSIHSGTKHNIISDEARLQITVRSYSEKVRDQLLKSIKRITRGIAQAAGIEENKMPEVKINDKYTPSLYNDPILTERLVKAFETVLGKNNVISSKPVMIGEDFALYGRADPKVPICMFFLGSVKQKQGEEGLPAREPLPSLHSATFAPDAEPTIKTGIKSMTAAVLELMEKK